LMGKGNERERSQVKKIGRSIRAGEKLPSKKRESS